MYHPYCAPAGSFLEIPTGYRFRPTEFELLQNFLLPKMMGNSLPIDTILDLDVYRFDPEQLPLNHFKHVEENEAHFFMLEDSVIKGRIRVTPNGYWDTTDTDVLVHESLHIYGFKTKLRFYRGQFPNGSETNWTMIEYRYNPDKIPADTITTGRYMVCKVGEKIKLEVTSSNNISQNTTLSPYCALMSSSLKLPTGYVFCPTEFELLEYYLLPRMMQEVLPVDCFFSLDMYRSDPEQLPMNHFKYMEANVAYFFVLEDSIGARETPSGFWKIYKTCVRVTNKSSLVCGLKNLLWFYRGKDPSGCETTDWRMAEYRYHDQSAIPPRIRKAREKYIVCKVWRENKFEEIGTGSA